MQKEAVVKIKECVGWKEQNYDWLQFKSIHATPQTRAMQCIIVHA